jgi:hypothetical protein
VILRAWNNTDVHLVVQLVAAVRRTANSQRRTASMTSSNAADPARQVQPA